MSDSEKLFLKKTIPLYFLILFLPLSGFVGYIIRDRNITTNQNLPLNGSDCVTAMQQIRDNKYEFTHPLLLTDIPIEDGRFALLKGNLINYLSSKTQEGVLKSASIYIRNLNDGSWTSINDLEKYSAGSLLKVPILIQYLKEEEKKSGILDKKILFEKHFSVPRNPVFVGKGLTPGTFYSIRQLLQSMIIDSDNDATILLDGSIDNNVSDQVFDALHLQRPNARDTDYFISVQDAAKFLRVLYSSTYLSPEMSDYALKLLTEQSFKDGLVKFLDPSIKVSRKFAERGSGEERQYHEMGIVYQNGKPYLISVMTKGKDLKELANVVADISQMVNSEMQQTFASK